MSRISFRQFFKAAWCSLMASALCMGVATAETADYPFADYNGPGSNASAYVWTDKDGTPVSPYGYYYRNCTDFVAWKLQSLGVAADLTRGLGNGGEWAGGGMAKKLQVDETPAAGSAAVQLPNASNHWGHVAYVQSVQEDGRITIVEYNFAALGSYGTRQDTPAKLGLTKFVHFEAAMQNGPDEPEPPAIPWNFTTLEGDGASASGRSGDIGGTPALLTYNGQPQAFYYDATEHALRHAWKSGAGWQFETLDGGNDDEAKGRGRVSWDVGKSPVAVNFGGALHVFYFDSTFGNLRHAWSGTNGWFFETLDGDGASIAQSEGLAGLDPSTVVFGDTLQLFYYDAGLGNLRHAWADRSGWHFEQLDGDSAAIGKLSGVLGCTSAVMVDGDHLHVFYDDHSGGRLRHAFTTAGGWQFENLDGDSGSTSHFSARVGLQPVATRYLDTLQLFYYDASNGSLRHAWLSRSGWQFETLDGVDSRLDAGQMPAVAVQDDGLHVLYYEATGKNIRHAWTTLRSGWRIENLDGAGGNNDSRAKGNVGFDPALIVTDGIMLALYYDMACGNLRQAWPQ